MKPNINRMIYCIGCKRPKMLFEKKRKRITSFVSIKMKYLKKTVKPLSVVIIVHSVQDGMLLVILL